MGADEGGAGASIAEVDACIVSASFLLCLLIARVVKKTWLSESSVFILVGFLLSLVVYVTDEHALSPVESFPSNFFFMILLPPIIFASGYTLKRKSFFQNLSSILVLAIIGPVVCAMIFGFFFWWLDLGFNFLESFMFGTLLSPTDPVAVLAQYSSLGVNAQLFSLVFGESVLNDAVAIIFFDVLSAAYVAGGDTGPLLVDSFIYLIVITFGSVGLGCLFGCASSLVLKHLSEEEHWDVTVLLVTAYTAYMVAEVLDLSGIVTIFFAGVCMGHYSFYTLRTHEAQDLSVGVPHVLSYICESFVFFFIGLSVMAFVEHYNWTTAAATFALCVVSRFITVCGLCCVLNLRRKEPITLKQMMALSYAGLRGAISFALASAFPSEELKSTVLACTLITVLGTNFLLGGTNWFVLSMMGPEMFEKADKSEEKKIKKPKTGWRWFDVKYIAPLISIPKNRRVLKEHSVTYSYLSHDPDADRDTNSIHESLLAADAQEDQEQATNLGNV